MNDDLKIIAVSFFLGALLSGLIVHGIHKDSTRETIFQIQHEAVRHGIAEIKGDHFFWKYEIEPEKK